MLRYLHGSCGTACPLCPRLVETLGLEWSEPDQRRGTTLSSHQSRPPGLPRRPASTGTVYLRAACRWLYLAAGLMHHNDSDNGHRAVPVPAVVSRLMDWRSSTKGLASASVDHHDGLVRLFRLPL